MSFRPGLKQCGAPFLATILLYAPTASAVFEPGVGVGLQYTDNAALTPNNEDDDWLVLGYVGARFEKTSGPLNFDGATSLTYEHYTDDTFSDQKYFDLNATAGWEMIKERVNWIARDYFTQRRRNSINSSTPNNIEDVNIFNIGPDVVVPISRVQKLVINPAFSDFYYQKSDTDNQRYSLALDWLYNASASNEVGMGGSFSKIDFDKEDKNPNFSASNIHAVLKGRLARSKYTFNVGFTRMDRDDFENRSAPTGSFDWQLNLTGRSSARLYAASDLTDASFSALDSAIDPGRGDINNVQISGDVFRNNILRASYSRKGATLKTRLWGELRDLDYKETPQDREIQNLGIKFDYQARALLSSALYAKYKRTKRTDRDRTDKLYTVGGNIAYQMSRKLRAVFNLEYRNKDSTDDAQEYNEFSGLINLVYGYGDLVRKKRPGN
ncbi:MAG TPA: hypothetical protein ENK05_03870 [Gammaproteobacteria bacterium]|nr:hypothetical protein [Gammaproteobacteria bacterium]